jgi:GNAT superfamily N-acetyltransferase
MAAITKPLTNPVMIKHLRPFDVQRDLRAVADLVELCFADTLDPDGRDYLARMRLAANGASILNMARGWSAAPWAGYVWEEDGKIVGNASLIPYYIKFRRFFLIANVAVHPSYRRRGIARKLTEQAVEYSRLRHVPAAWLHVRQDNQAALDLYASLGFKPRAVRTTWLGEPDYSVVGSVNNTPSGSQWETPPGLHFIVPNGSHWPVLSAWLNRSYSPELSWHMPFHANNLRPGIIGALSRLFFNTYIRQWGVIQDGRLGAAVAWQTTGSYANVIWLAAPLKGDELAVRELLRYVRRHSPTRRTLALDYPANQYKLVIQEAGFVEQQTLVWMSLALSQN